MRYIINAVLHLFDALFHMTAFDTTGLAVGERRLVLHIGVVGQFIISSRQRDIREVKFDTVCCRGDVADGSGCSHRVSIAVNED